MTVKKRRGPIAKTIENLCVELCSGIITETKFKEGIRKVCQERTSLVSIGTALQRSAMEYCADKMDYLWQLADEVEPKIRRAYERYKTEFLGVTGEQTSVPKVLDI